jgi:hypothetical protein
LCRSRFGGPGGTATTTVCDGRKRLIHGANIGGPFSDKQALRGKFFCGAVWESGGSGPAFFQDKIFVWRIWRQAAQSEGEKPGRQNLIWRRDGPIVWDKKWAARQFLTAGPPIFTRNGAVRQNSTTNFL